MAAVRRAAPAANALRLAALRVVQVTTLDRRKRWIDADTEQPVIVWRHVRRRDVDSTHSVPCRLYPG
eukprot:4499485-Prymnesium_polylepis.2